MDEYFDKYEIIVSDKFDEKSVLVCEKIAWENNHFNKDRIGKGKLRYIGLVSSYADFLVRLVCDGKTMGFLALTENYKKQNDLYIMLGAVRPEMQNIGVMTKLLTYLVRHSAGFDYLTADSRKDDKKWWQMLEKFGFRHTEVEKDEDENYHYVLDVKNVTENLSLKDNQG